MITYYIFFEEDDNISPWRKNQIIIPSLKKINIIICLDEDEINVRLDDDISFQEEELIGVGLADDCIVCRQRLSCTTVWGRGYLV
jgi:hypothetical protein